MNPRIKYIHTIIAFLLLAVSGCSSDDENGTGEILNGERRVFFNVQNIDVNRSSASPVTVEIRYQGPKTSESIEVAYTVSAPAEDGAVEGEDYVLPKSGSFTIENGNAVTSVVLLQRVINNENADRIRSLRFELQSQDDVIIGNTDNSGSDVTLTFATTLEIDPLDPEGFIGDQDFFFMEEGESFRIPYFANTTDIANTSNTSITSAVIGVHGSGRNAQRPLEVLTLAAQIEGVNLDGTLLISPQYVGDDEVAQFSLSSDYPFWGGTEWRTGDDAEEQDISSFAVMDSLIYTLARYENMQSIVLTGHSAGGQFTARYAASSPVADSLATLGISMRFVVNNPGTYTYMDNKRKVPGTENTFEVPQAFVIASCPNYNVYEHGLDDLPPYLDAIGEDGIRERLAQRRVAYLIGQNDNDASPEETSINEECESILQGRDRFERATNFFNHLLDFYGPSINENITFEVVPNAGHSSGEMYPSEIGRRNLFRNP